MNTLTGSGMLRADGVDVSKIAYRIHITTTGTFRSARGTFLGQPEVLIATMASRETTLVRDDNGFEMKVILTHVDASGNGTLSVSGPPGPNL